MRRDRRKSLSLSIREGKLHVEYFVEGHKMHHFPVDLSLPIDNWSTVQIRRDFRTMRISVNDRAASSPLTLPGMDIGPIVFGGFGETSGKFSERTGNPNWFKGLMRNLRIVHNTQSESRPRRNPKTPDVISNE